MRPLETGGNLDPIQVFAVICISVTIIVAATMIWYYYFDYNYTGSQGGTCTIAWQVSVEDGNYLIEIIDVEPQDSSDVSWSILDLNRLKTTWQDPSGENLSMEGDLSDIKYHQTDFDIATTTNGTRFYSRDPSGDPPVNKNSTLCVVFVDKNDNDKMDSGDEVWIRSVKKGGVADEDFRFRMVNEKPKDAYGELVLPGV